MSSQHDGLDKVLAELGIGPWSFLFFTTALLVPAILPVFLIGGEFFNPTVAFTCRLPGPGYSHYNGSECYMIEHRDESGRVDGSRPEVWKERSGAGRLERSTGGMWMERSGKEEWMEGTRGGRRRRSGEGTLERSEKEKLRIVPAMMMERSGGGGRVEGSGEGEGGLEGSGGGEGEGVVVPCTSWDYDTSVFTSTISMEWDLVCDRAGLSSMFQTLYTAGNFCGAILAAVTADRFGRRWAVRVGTAVTLSGLILLLSTPWLVCVLLARFIIGAANPLMIYPSFILAMEICVPSLRPKVGMVLALPYALMMMGLAALAYAIREWRTLQAVASFPCLIMVPMVFLVDESPRWLVVQGRVGEAVKALQRAGVLHRVTLPDQHTLHAILTNAIQDGKGNKQTRDGRMRELRVSFAEDETKRPEGETRHRKGETEKAEKESESPNLSEQGQKSLHQDRGSHSETKTIDGETKKTEGETEIPERESKRPSFIERGRRSLHIKKFSTTDPKINSTSLCTTSKESAGSNNLAGDWNGMGGAGMVRNGLERTGVETDTLKRTERDRNDPEWGGIEENEVGWNGTGQTEQEKESVEKMIAGIGQNSRILKGNDNHKYLGENDSVKNIVQKNYSYNQLHSHKTGCHGNEKIYTQNSPNNHNIRDDRCKEEGNNQGDHSNERSNNQDSFDTLSNGEINNQHAHNNEKAITEHAIEIHEKNQEGVEKNQPIILHDPATTNHDHTETTLGLDDGRGSWWAGPVALVRTPVIRRIMVTLVAMWILQGVVYLGLPLSSDLFSSPFLYMGLLGLVEIPAYTLSAPITLHFGRRPVVAYCLVSCGLLLLAQMILLVNDVHLEWASLTLILSSYLFVCTAYQVNFLYAPELLPTTLRPWGTSMCTLSAYVGFSIPPFITDYLAVDHPWAASLVFGFCGLLAGCLAFLLPETNGRPLPETVADLKERLKTEKLRRKKKGVREEVVGG